MPKIKKLNPQEREEINRKVVIKMLELIKKDIDKCITRLDATRSE